MLLFHSLTNTKASGGKELCQVWERLLASEDGTVPVSVVPECLRKGPFLVPVEGEADQSALRHLQAEIPQATRDDVWFFVTEACTNHCRYCRQRIAGVKGTRALEVTGVQKFWTWYFGQRTREHVSLSLFGGEPSLLGLGLIDILEESERCCVTANARIGEKNMFSNGMAVSGDLAQELSNRGVKVVLSFDGPAFVNDVMRGQGRFAGAMRARARFASLGENVGISLAVGPHNAAYLPEIAVFFAESLKPKNICFIPMHRTRGAPDDIFVAYDYIAQQMLRAYDLAAPLGLYIENVSRLVDLFVTGSVRYSACGATSTRVVLFPDGTVGPCQSSYIEPSLRVPLSEASLAGPEFKQWECRSPFFTEGCLNCHCLGICGGGCGLDSIQRGRGIRETDPRDCAVPNAFLNWAVDRVLARTDGDAPTTILGTQDLLFLRRGMVANPQLPFRGVAGSGRLTAAQVAQCLLE